MEKAAAGGKKRGRSARHLDPAKLPALYTIVVGVALVIMDSTIANVATPVVLRDLKMNSSQVEWMTAIYSLVFAALLLTVGRVGDLYGRRRVFVSGMIVFLIGSVLAGSAVSGEMLISARFIEGVGAAMIMPTALSTLNVMFVGRDRSIAFATYGAVIGGMAAVGPLVGGWLATDVTWRWAFWLNIPFAVLVLIGAFLFLKENSEEGAHGLDVGGAVLSAIGMGGIVFGLIEGQFYGWFVQKDGSVSPVPFAFGIGIVALIWFILLERSRRRAGKTVLLDLTLFRIKTFRFGATTSLIIALGEYGLLFVLPLLLQNALGFSALGTGWLIFALAIGTFFISALVPNLAHHLSTRTIVRIGVAIEAVALFGLGLSISADITGWGIAAWLFIYGIGTGMTTSQLTNIVLSEVPEAESGQASGAQSTGRQIGSAFGIAIMGAILLAVLGSSTRASLEDQNLPTAQVTKITDAVTASDGSIIPQLKANPETAKQGQAAADALIDASKLVALTGSGVLVLGLITTLAIPRPRKLDAIQQETLPAAASE
ncbi:MFS transporter [Leifsonia sp. A12D58]|uniref:MFS transporter n=1 Tax=Leifsonia sp. A12D58 TaxID=3397674 RepID=UPI0039E0365C